MTFKHISFGLNKVNQMKTTHLLSIISLCLKAFCISQDFPWRVVSTSPITTMIWTKLAKHVSRGDQMPTVEWVAGIVLHDKVIEWHQILWVFRRKVIDWEGLWIDIVRDLRWKKTCKLERGQIYEMSLLFIILLNQLLSS